MPEKYMIIPALKYKNFLAYKMIDWIGLNYIPYCQREISNEVPEV